jgi:hypothetical protein
MAIMNKVGVFLYNICLFLLIGILFLGLKNFNLDAPRDTLDYSNNLKTVLFIFIWAYYAFGVTLSLGSLLSKARKKRGGFTFLMLGFWAMMGINALFAFMPDILKEDYTTPVWRYSMIMITIIIGSIFAFGLIFHQFPGTVDRNFLINEVKKKIVKEEVKAKSYCPECKYPSEKDWKHCPKCGVHFSD